MNSLNPAISYIIDSVFILPDTDTETKKDTDTDKLAQNPMGIRVAVCLCSMNTSTQFFTTQSLYRS